MTLVFRKLKTIRFLEHATAQRTCLLAIAARAGLPLQTIQRTTLSGAVPFLFPQRGELDSEYHSVIYELPGVAQDSLVRFSSWLRYEGDSSVIGCRRCLNDYPNAAVLLSWRLSVVLSCPIHGLMLEPARKHADAIIWVRDKPEVAPKLISILDGRSMMAVSERFVQLPGGSVTAAQWFALLQTILHELNPPPFSISPEQLRMKLQVWEAADYHPPALRSLSTFDKNHALLIATAIELMENRLVIPTGLQGKIFSG
jgi:hypothetical protein